MIRLLSLVVLAGFFVQDAADSAVEKAKLHEELAKGAEKVADQLLKWKSWDEARAFLDVVRAKSDARAEALDKLLAKTEKQTSGWEWDRRTSELIKEFGKERAKKFYAFARAWKEKDAEASGWTDAEGEILDDLLDYLKSYGRLCQVRSQHALPKTRFDWKLSVPAVWHAKYLVKNPDDDGEIEGKPGYTPEGRATSSKSITNTSKHLLSMFDEVYHSPFMRGYLLRPSLIRIGLAQSGATSTSSVLDVESATEAALDKDIVIPCPFDKASNVPTKGPTTKALYNGKLLSELGYPITLTFFDPDAKVTDVKARLVDVKGSLDIHLSSPEEPAIPDKYPSNGNAVLLIPKDPLRPNTKYSVEVHYAIKGQKSSFSWTFSTLP